MDRNAGKRAALVFFTGCFALTGCAPSEPIPVRHDEIPERVVRRPAPFASGTAVRVVLYQTPEGPVLVDALLVDEIASSSETGDLLVIDEEGAIVARAEVPEPETIAPPPLGDEAVTAVTDWGAALEVVLPWSERAAAVVLGDDRIEYPPRLDVEVKADEGVPGAVAIYQEGDGAHRWDVVFLAEGFTAREMSTFEAQARRLADELRGGSPFREYAEFFNFWMIPTTSNTSGIGTSNAVDTRFGCYMDRATSVIMCERRQRASELAQAALASADFSIIVANDRAGGRASASSRTVIMNTSSSDTVFRHEFAHLFGLGDEYVYTNEVGGTGANCSPRAPAPWESAWTPVDPNIGSFLGCGRSSYYRPTEESCLMRTLNHSAFCAVCNERLVRQFPNGFFRTTPVPRPEDGGNIVVGPGPVEFGVEFASIPTFRYRWELDGMPLSDTGMDHVVDACAFGSDTTTRHILQIFATNESTALRPDYRRVTSSSATWYLVGSAACAGPTMPAEDTDTAIDIQSTHPYANGASLSFEVEAPPGTARMRLRFSRIDLEPNYDFLDVRDASGAVVARYTGAHSETLTPEITGARATLHLTSDASVNRWGFALDRIIRSSEAEPTVSWTRTPSTIESAHPYGNNRSETWTVAPPGATAARLHFASFRTEQNYDVVTIYDRNGTRLDSYSGARGEFVTNVFANPPLRIEFRSDQSVTDDGFRIDWIEHR